MHARAYKRVFVFVCVCVCVCVMCKRTSLPGLLYRVRLERTEVRIGHPLSALCAWGKVGRHLPVLELRTEHVGRLGPAATHVHTHTHTHTHQAHCSRTAASYACLNIVAHRRMCMYCVCVCAHACVCVCVCPGNLGSEREDLL